MNCSLELPVIVDFLFLPLCPSSNIAEEEAAAHLWRQLHIYIYIFKLLLWYHSRCNFNDVHYLKYTLYYTL